MKVNEYAKLILDVIDSLSDNSWNAELDIYKRIKSYQSAQKSDVAIKKLKDELTNLLSNENELSIAELKPIYDCIANYWNEIRGTDQIYNFTHLTSVSKAYMTAAREIQRELDENIYRILMPTLNVDVSTIFGNVKSLRPHEFILSDPVMINGKLVELPIEISPCLNAAKRNNGLLKLTCTPVDMEKRELTEDEKMRVIHHSDATLKYYEGEIDNQKLFDELLDEQKYQVKSSYWYGKDKELKTNVLSSITSDTDLIDILVKVVNKSEWKSFLDSIPADELKRIAGDPLINFDKLKAKLLTVNMYKQDNHLHNRAVLMFLSELYQRLRFEQGNTWLGSSMTSKLDAVGVFQCFMMSDVELNNLEKYLKGNNKLACKSDIEYGKLGDFSKQAILVCGQNYFQTNVQPQSRSSILSYFY